MIITKYYATRKDKVDLMRTYSDLGFKIRKVGTDEVYDEAIDVIGAPFVYEETAEKIEESAVDENG